MPGGSQPVGNLFIKFGSGHAGMGRHDDLHDAFHSRGTDGFHVASQQRLERLFGFPLRVLRGEFLDALKGEQNLGIYGIFHPQGAVVVEGGDAFGRCNVVLAVLVRDGRNKLED